MSRKGYKITGFSICLLMLLLAFSLQLMSEAVGIAMAMAGLVMERGEPLSYQQLYRSMNTLLENNDIIMYLSVLAASVCGVVFGLWYYWGFVKKEMEEETGAVSFSALPRLILLGIGLQLFLSMGLTMIEEWQPAWFEEYNKLMENLTIKDSLPAMAYVVLVGPVSEELIFRGAILSKAKRYLPFWQANALQAFLFGVYHLNLIQGLYAFFIGIVFGAVRMCCDSIFASIVLHISFNATSVAVLYLVGEEEDIGWQTGSVVLAGGLVLATAMLVSFFRDRRKKEKKKE